MADDFDKKAKKENSFNSREELEFVEESKEKVKLREGGIGESPSLQELEKFLRTKKKLKSLLEDKRKQKGLAYRLGIKRKKANIDQEIEEVGEEYHQLLNSIKMKTGYSDEEVKEYIEGGRAEKVSNILDVFQKEILEAKERFGPAKKELFNLLSTSFKDKRTQFLLGKALTGTALVSPSSSFINILTLGFNSEYAPFDFGFSLGSQTILLNDVLRERREKQIDRQRAVRFSFKENDSLAKEEIELRDSELGKVKNELEVVTTSEPEIILPQEEEPVIEEEEKPVEQPEPESEEEKELSLSQLQRIEEELLTGKPPKEKKE